MASSASGGFVTAAGPVLGTGAHQIQLLLGEDFFAGDVQVTISVNGVQLGGVQSVTAQQANGQNELFTLNGDWSGTPTVSVNFLNDDWNGSTGNGNDRNLYVDGVSYDGTVASSTVRPVLWSGPVYASTRAFTRASDFVATIGVTTHLLYADTTYHDETLVLASLAYLGIDHVRDGGGMLDPNAVLPFERAMAAGIEFNFTSSTDGGVATEIARLKTLVAAHPGGITSIEGINEAAASFQYAGLTGQAAALKFQQDLYAAVKAEPTLAGIPVINYTLLSQDPADYTRYGDVSATADLGNIHLYPYGGLQSQETTLLPRELSGTPHSAGYVVTELGYDTQSNAPDIQAKYMLDGLLDAYLAGASATYLYELLDDRADPGLTDVEDHFGIFNADGTPKPAATALHNLTSLLADAGATAGSFTPGALGYVVTGLPTTGSSLMLAKSDGSFDLAVWAEPQIRASSTSAAEVAAPLVPVTVTFDRNEASVVVYDPLLGTAPIASYSNVRSVVLGITDHPLIVAIQPIVVPVVTTPVVPVVTAPVVVPVVVVPPVVTPPVVPVVTAPVVVPVVVVPPMVATPVVPVITSPVAVPVVIFPSVVPPTEPQSDGAVYRFFDSRTGTQFLTSSASERDAVLATRPDLVSEGVGIGAVMQPDGDANALAVYRFFDTVSGTHFYTSSGAERDDLVANRFDLVYEGQPFFEHQTAAAGDEAVYRFFNAGNGTHFYTSSASERSAILTGRPDLVPEGVAFYAPAT